MIPSLQKINTRGYSTPVDLSDTTEYLTISVDDLNLYFAQTYLMFSDMNEWAQVKRFDCNIQGHIFIRIKGREEHFDLLKTKTINFAFPETGLYNYKKGVLYLYRKTDRQNKKGLCNFTAGMLQTNLLFEQFISLPERFKLSQIWRWTHQNLNSLLLPQGFPELEKAYSNVFKLKSFSTAISRDFFLGQGITSKHPSLWFRKTLIGRVLDKNKLVIDNRIFLQEGIDFFSPLGVTINADNA